MSRSFKKNPIIKDNGKSKKWWKRYGNNVCKQHDLPDGCFYKRLVNPYNFCDYLQTMLGCSKRDEYYNSKYGGDYGEDMFRLRRK